MSAGLNMAQRRQIKRQREIDYAGRQQATTRCARCRWSFVGPIRDGKRAFEMHRERCGVAA